MGYCRGSLEKALQPGPGGRSQAANWRLHMGPRPCCCSRWVGRHLLSNLSWQVLLLEGDEQIAETRAVPYGVRPSPSLADPALRDAQDVLDIMAKVALFMKSMKSLRSSFERSWLTSLKILIGNLYKSSLGGSWLIFLRF